MGEKTMNSWDKAIAQVRLRLAAFLFLKNALATITVWLFLWGTGILILRVAFQASPWLLLWGLAAVPVLPLAAVVCGLRKAPALAGGAPFPPPCPATSPSPPPPPST